MSKRELPRNLDDPAEPSGLGDIFTGYGLQTAADELARALSTIPARPGLSPHVAPDGSLEVAGLRFSATSLQFPAQFDHAAWQAVGQFFRQTRSALQWWIGDWINAADTAWGETYTEAVQLTGLKEGYLRNVASIAGRVDLSLRSDKLSFSHYQELISRVAPEEWPAWIARAIAGGLSRRKLVAAIEGQKKPDGDIHPLQNRLYRRRFSRVWRAISQGNAPDVADLDELEAWIKELRRVVAGADNA